MATSNSTDKLLSDHRICTFWSRVNKDGPIPSSCPELGPCWIWTGGVVKGGYGLFGTGLGSGHRKSQLAHRLSWFIANGESPDGLFVLHRCDNPSCVNPSHLRLGTHQENMAERDFKKRVACGEKSGVAVLTDEKVREIRKLRLLGYTYIMIANSIGVAQTTVRQVLNGKTWKHVT